MEAINDLEKAEKKINEPFAPPVATPQGGVVTPKTVEMKKNKESSKTKEPLTVVEKIHKFAIDSGMIYVQNGGTPKEKWFATAPVFNYVLALNECHAVLDDTWEENTPLGAIIYAKGHLEDKDRQVIGRTTMCASSTESWLIDKDLSAIYALAQTRMEERLCRMAFGYQLTLARFEPIGAEELDVNPVEYGTKDKEI